MWRYLKARDRTALFYSSFELKQTLEMGEQQNKIMLVRETVEELLKERRRNLRALIGIAMRELQKSFLLIDESNIQKWDELSLAYEELKRLGGVPAVLDQAYQTLVAMVHSRSVESLSFGVPIDLLALINRPGNGEKVSWLAWMRRKLRAMPD